MKRDMAYALWISRGMRETPLYCQFRSIVSIISIVPFLSPQSKTWELNKIEIVFFCELPHGFNNSWLIGVQVFDPTSLVSLPSIRIC